MTNARRTIRFIAFVACSTICGVTVALAQPVINPTVLAPSSREALPQGEVTPSPSGKQKQLRTLPRRPKRPFIEEESRRGQ
jgi:hypothetical protein